eukprot:scaffold282705_cov27-Tisochrysis_lutea.AAC.1
MPTWCRKVQCVEETCGPPSLLNPGTRSHQASGMPQKKESWQQPVIGNLPARLVSVERPTSHTLTSP